ncbi:hypothetical protein TRIUR3_17200 [Triticum urartu]|uniref:Uncharacterized protein n=1 Tax=Triticum urartu TaxID=4572 RepID=M7ZS48_TRIUA|nr:hypothetical protein TRIUR3_17200 [Triticum urartu]
MTINGRAVPRRLWVTHLIKHPRFYCAPLAPALGTRRLSELLLTIGGARACGYGVAQQGNTGCGIETAPIATRSKAKDAHLDWQGMKVDTKVDVDFIEVSIVRSSVIVTLKQNDGLWDLDGFS